MQAKPQARAYASMATLNRKLGEFDTAIKLARQAIPLAETAKDASTRASALSCLGNIDLDRGNLEAALKNFTEILQLHRAGKNRGGTMSALNALGIKQVAILLSEMAMYEAWKTDPDYEEATRLYEVMLSKTAGGRAPRGTDTCADHGGRCPLAVADLVER